MLSGFAAAGAAVPGWGPGGEQESGARVPALLEGHARLCAPGSSVWSYYCAIRCGTGLLCIHHPLQQWV
jgi:hypothetical protein